MIWLFLTGCDLFDKPTRNCEYEEDSCTTEWVDGHYTLVVDGREWSVVRNGDGVIMSEPELGEVRFVVAERIDHILW